MLSPTEAGAGVSLGGVGLGLGTAGPYDPYYGDPYYYRSPGYVSTAGGAGLGLGLGGVGVGIGGKDAFASSFSIRPVKVSPPSLSTEEAIGGHHPASSESACGASLHDDMRRLWTDHVLWTRMYIIDKTLASPDSTSTLTRLMKNQEDLGDLFGRYYGPAVGKRVTDLLKEHIIGADKALTAAQKRAVSATSRTATNLKTAKEEWYRNAVEISSALHELNPDAWSYFDLKKAMYKHLDDTLSEINFRLAQNFDRDVEAYDDVQHHALRMADLFSSGISDQFCGGGGGNKEQRTEQIGGRKSATSVPPPGRYEKFRGGWFERLKASKTSSSEGGGGGSGKFRLRTYVEKPRRIGNKCGRQNRVDDCNCYPGGGCGPSALGFYLDPCKNDLPWAGGNLWWYAGENLYRYKPLTGTGGLACFAAAPLRMPRPCESETLALFRRRHVASKDGPCPCRRCCAMDPHAGVECPYVASESQRCPHCGEWHYCSSSHAAYFAKEFLVEKLGFVPPPLQKKGLSLYYCPCASRVWAMKPSAAVVESSK